MRGIGALGGFVFVGVLLVACSESLPDTTTHALEAPTWVPSGVQELELADPRASVNPAAAETGTTESRVSLTSGVDDPTYGLSCGTTCSWSCVRLGADDSDQGPVERVQFRRASVAEAMPSRPYADCAFLLDQDFGDVDIEATLSVAGGHSRTCFFIKAGQAFRFDGLDPGVATVTIFGNSTIVLGRVESILIPDQGPALDPRLAAVDLRGRVRPLRARLVDAKGQACAHLRFWATDNDRLVVHMRTDKDGWTCVALPSHMHSLEANVTGFHPVRLFDQGTISLDKR
jgi:hypothetical protein